MVNISGTLGKLQSIRALVIGDLLLDTYTIGKASRISPEAPVAIVHVLREENRAGGAGNVALNLISLGAQVTLVGRIGADRAGKILQASLVAEGIATEGLFTQDAYGTPIKNRIMADNQQIVRVDHEEVVSLAKDVEAQVVSQLPQLMEGIQVVAISDYGKGFLSTDLLKKVIAEAKKRSIPILTDPKGIDFAKYAGSTLLKPNLGEAYAAAKLSRGAPLDEVAKRLFAEVAIDQLMITRSEEGISLFNQNGDRSDYPVKAREVKDVTGAGDTVLAVLAYGMANDLSQDETITLCNLAAGIAIERVGCARVTLGDLALQLHHHDPLNKIYSEKELVALKHAVGLKPCQLIHLNSQDPFSPQLFQAIRQLCRANQSIVLHFEDLEADADLAHLLASLKEVDAIFMGSLGLVELQRHLGVKAAYRYHKGACHPLDLSLATH